MNTLDKRDFQAKGRQKKKKEKENKVLNFFVLEFYKLEYHTRTKVHYFLHLHDHLQYLSKSM